MSRSIGINDELRDYVRRWGMREHPVLERCRRETAAMSDSRMQVSPEQGAFMQTMAQALGARRALEVGVYTGYSSTAVALTMQAAHGAEAKLIACDISETYAEKARGYWREAGVDKIVDLRIAPAKTTLEGLRRDGASFDLMFIDADKTSYGDYYDLGVELLRKGGMMLVDNMLWGGAVVDAKDNEADTVALRALAKRIHADERVTMALTSIGDGLSIVVKR